MKRKAAIEKELRSTRCNAEPYSCMVPSVSNQAENPSARKPAYNALSCCIACTKLERITHVSGPNVQIYLVCLLVCGMREYSHCMIVWNASSPCLHLVTRLNPARSCCLLMLPVWLTPCSKADLPCCCNVWSISFLLLSVSGCGGVCSCSSCSDLCMPRMKGPVVYANLYTRRSQDAGLLDKCVQVVTVTSGDRCS
jgi:hypothetical protein